MPKFELSRAARQDLKAIGRFSRVHFGQTVAASYLRGFTAEFARLVRLPQLGQARPEYGATVRCKVYRSHRILYESNDTGICILRILHHAQSVPDTISQ
ncbi:MAG: type II toxin-antitoxin system RelE/ParE family toxin [Novosphingobium sp.]|nr:type II toxin-antitoxin system RelE/ParE family toxin [Novosphingobium sp.]